MNRDQIFAYVRERMGGAQTPERTAAVVIRKKGCKECKPIKIESHPVSREDEGDEKVLRNKALPRRESGV